MSHLIVSVDPHSPAERAGVRAGDRLTHLQSQVVVDFLDYQALSASRRVRIRLLRDGRALETVAVKGRVRFAGHEFLHAHDVGRAHVLQQMPVLLCRSAAGARAARACASRTTTGA